LIYFNKDTIVKGQIDDKNSGYQQPKNVVIDGAIGAQALRTPNSKPILSKGESHA
jgi:hypothetical protein